MTDDMDDDIFRHVMGLIRHSCRDPKREKVMRELLIRRDPEHAQDVLNDIGKIKVAFSDETDIKSPQRAE